MTPQLSKMGLHGLFKPLVSNSDAVFERLDAKLLLSTANGFEITL